ncbi:hypothetical protein ACFVJM_10640 [Streptomyces virginiae]|uniref:hypothetical protein n=1 Tax=Streptomyces virginiae TaxID=1961 RepID=UPI00363B70D0
MARRKLITLRGGRSAHRACGPSADGRPRVAPSPGAAPAATPLAQQQKPKQKPMSRAELLKRIEELRARDAKKKPAARPQPRSSQPQPKPKATAKAKAAPRPSAAAARTTPQPYYGVEMKSVGGRWVQMHPESE